MIPNILFGQIVENRRENYLPARVDCENHRHMDPPDANNSCCAPLNPS